MLGARIEKIIEEQDEDRKRKERIKKNAESKERRQTRQTEELKSQFEQEKKKILKTGNIEGNKIYQDMPEERIYEINQTLKAQEDAFFSKWLKVRETKGINSQANSAVG